MNFCPDSCLLGLVVSPLRMWTCPFLENYIHLFHFQVPPRTPLTYLVSLPWNLSNWSSPHCKSSVPHQGWGGVWTFSHILPHDASVSSTMPPPRPQISCLWALPRSCGEWAHFSFEYLCNEWWSAPPRYSIFDWGSHFSAVGCIDWWSLTAEFLLRNWPGMKGLASPNVNFLLGKPHPVTAQWRGKKAWAPLSLFGTTVKSFLESVETIVMASLFHFFLCPVLLLSLLHRWVSKSSTQWTSCITTLPRHLFHRELNLRHLSVP